MATSMLRTKQKGKVSNKMAARDQTGSHSARKQFITVWTLSAEGAFDMATPMYRLKHGFRRQKRATLRWLV